MKLHFRKAKKTLLTRLVQAFCVLIVCSGILFFIIHQIKKPLKKWIRNIEFENFENYKKSEILAGGGSEEIQENDDKTIEVASHGFRCTKTFNWNKDTLVLCFFLFLKKTGLSFFVKN